MTRKIIINGISYDSPDAMPPDVRRQYEQALQMMKEVGQGTAPQGTIHKTVKTVPGGVSINVEERRVRYNIDGKTYDDPAQLPPEIRARVAHALEGAAQLDVRAEPPREVQVVEVHTEIRRSHGMGRLLVWLLIGAAVALVVLSRL